MLDPNNEWRGLIERIFESSRYPAHVVGDFTQGDDVEHPQWRLRQAILVSLDSLADPEDINTGTSLDFIVNIWSSCLYDQGMSSSLIYL